MMIDGVAIIVRPFYLFNLSIAFFSQKKVPGIWNNYSVLEEFQSFKGMAGFEEIQEFEIFQGFEEIPRFRMDSRELKGLQDFRQIPRFGTDLRVWDEFQVLRGVPSVLK